jgi:hypothetical protein
VLLAPRGAARAWADVHFLDNGRATCARRARCCRRPTSTPSPERGVSQTASLGAALEALLREGAASGTITAAAGTADAANAAA